MKKVLELGLFIGTTLALTAGSMFYGEQIKDDFVNSKRNSVVEIRNLAQTNGGTGFFLTMPSGKVKTVTNGHVCGLADASGAVVAYLTNDIEILYVEAIYEDNDLCVLSAPDKAIPLTIANSVNDTENIYVLGFPLLESKTLVKGQVSGFKDIAVFQGYDVKCEGKTYKKVSPEAAGDLLGMISGAQYLCFRVTPAMIATANILPGNSGSPALNKYGHVVGVAFAGALGTGRGMIVPLADLKNFLKDK